MEESQLRQIILGKLRDQTLPRDASFANTIPAFFESTHKGVNEMDPPLCGMAVISHNEVSEIDPHVTARRRVP
jgi:hypothetical protein